MNEPVVTPCAVECAKRLPGRSPIDRLAAWIAPRNARGAMRVGEASMGDRAALRRLVQDKLQMGQFAALSRAAIFSGLAPERWSTQQRQFWILIAHGIALAGHDRSRQFGAQLATARVSEARVTRLLTARGAAFEAALLRVVRLMESRDVAPNWNQIGRLVLKQSSERPKDREFAETLRVRIAGDYYSALHRASQSTTTGTPS